MIAALCSALRTQADVLAVALPMEIAQMFLLPAAELPRGNTVIVAAVPYFAGCDDGPVSLYARGRDYHKVLPALFAETAHSIGLDASQLQFFTDVSPFREVRLAATAGLGVVGDNGLLLTERFGSYVFLGEICGDLTGETAIPQEIRTCSHCGACRRACPTQGNGCLSEITQRRGILTADESALMRKYHTAWGCDICQTVCPLNRNAQQTKLPAFCEELVNTFDDEIVSTLSNRAVERLYADRAFVWRGGSVIKRNAKILREG